MLTAGIAELLLYHQPDFAIFGSFDRCAQSNLVDNSVFILELLSDKRVGIVAGDHFYKFIIGYDDSQIIHLLLDQPGSYKIFPCLIFV